MNPVGVERVARLTAENAREVERRDGEARGEVVERQWFGHARDEQLLRGLRKSTVSVTGCARGLVPENGAEQSQRRLLDEERVVRSACKVARNQVLLQVGESVDGCVRRDKLSVANRTGLALE